MRPPVRLNHAELDALKGLPHAARVVYVEGVRPFMDFSSGVVGASSSPNKSISLQSLAEVLYVEPKPGRTGTGSRSRKQARVCIDVLVDAGLLSSMSVSTKQDKRLVLKCVLADTDKSASNKQGTNRAQEQGTNRAQDKASSDAGLDGSAQQEQGTPETPYQGTPPISGIKDTTTARVRESGLIPDDFCIDDQVRATLLASGVPVPVAEFFIDEFVSDCVEKGKSSFNWAAAFVVYCKKWRWRYDKERGNDAASGGADQQRGQSRASRVHEREKRLYQEAIAREQGAEDIHSSESSLRPQVVVPYRRPRDS